MRQLCAKRGAAKMMVHARSKSLDRKAPVFSHVVAPEYSPRRKPWGKREKRASPVGAEEPPMCGFTFPEVMDIKAGSSRIFAPLGLALSFALASTAYAVG